MEPLMPIPLLLSFIVHQCECFPWRTFNNEFPERSFRLKNSSLHSQK